MNTLNLSIKPTSISIKFDSDKALLGNDYIPLHLNNHKYIPSLVGKLLRTVNRLFHKYG